jgi:glycosyltransferase involved in cell wall biosynthesis
MAVPRVTVVVPSRARPASLARCLEALNAQTIAAEVEVLVVQDGEDIDLGPVAKTAGARLIVQERGGPGVARNRGAAEARASLLCFTDDDCEAAPDWCERLAGALARGAPAVLGRTLNADRDRFGATSQLVVNTLAAHSRARGRPFGPSSNFACRRDVFLQVPFDAMYRFAGGDRSWCTRMHEAGYGLEWDPNAVVFHHQALTARRFWRQHVAWGRGSYHYRRRTGTPLRPEDASLLLGLLRRAQRDGPTVLGLAILSQLATGAGYLREAVAELASAKRESRRASERASVSSPRRSARPRATIARRSSSRSR